jgi:hypothetical protein
MMSMALDALAVAFCERDPAMPRFMHVGHEGFGRADRLLLLAAYPPMFFLVDLSVVAVE